MKTFADYQQQAARTAGADTKPFEVHLMISTLGLCGEAAELYATVKDYLSAPPGVIVKEAGDVLWYAADLARLLEISLEYPNSFGAWNTAVTRMAGDVAVLAGLIADHVKKHTGHGHDLDPALIGGHLQTILAKLAGIGVMYGYTLEEIGEANIKKLDARYPNGFSPEASKERAE
jgi:NTP pyrophosphatase (non-canonical NTP hydrolase)